MDRVFARIGASDNLVQYQSTFMSEMLETAFILANATEKSLVVVDEIGKDKTSRRSVRTKGALTLFWNKNKRNNLHVFSLEVNLGLQDTSITFYRETIVKVSFVF